ncbi:hypothetical protein GALMADRAFT_106788 [Galerina marginata CBS 339.88]|uniref:Uncharacterized protein n=1 Tax=Galerina marginata (strain CBS 339.88) TaxID=685588 RepID=A0A067S4F5_GALM3|nr:hypothetical protein GALMADRAFT_106788 [Galerina marginata CBS 339.88]
MCRATSLSLSKFATVALMNIIPRSTSLEYKLPSNVESIRKGWISSIQASTYISGLFAIAATILLIFNLGSCKIAIAPGSSDNKVLALEVISYASIFLNISACLSCFILIDRLGDIPYHASQNPNLTKGGSVSLRQQEILKIYGVGALWRWVVWHWLFCFTFGAWSIFAQLVLYIWLQESKDLRIAMAALMGFCSLPFFAFLLAPVFNVLFEFSPFQKGTSTRSDSDVTSPTTIPDIESGPTSPNSTRSPNRSPTRTRPRLPPIRPTSSQLQFPPSTPFTAHLYDVKTKTMLPRGPTLEKKSSSGQL